MYDIESYRALFPHIKTGKLWLNHAAIGPLSDRTRTAVERYLLSRSSGSIDDFPEIFKTFDDTRTIVASTIHTTKDRIAFCESTTNGLNLLVNGLEWKTGDRILLNDTEFPANVVPFLNAKRYGVEIDFIKSVNGEITPEMVEASITPKTRLLSISFVQFLSGFKADLAAISTVCKRHNVIVSVDAIQGIGAAPIDVAKSGIDFLACGVHKWLMGMNGAAFLYVTPELQARIRQRYAGWTSNKNFFSKFFNYRIDFDDTARRYESGSMNNAGIISLRESLTMLNEAGIGQIHEHLLSLTDRVISWADERGYSLLTPRERTKRAGIVSFAIDHAEGIFDQLNKMDVIISLRDGKLRVSPHFYNTTDDIDRLCSAMTSAARTVNV